MWRFAIVGRIGTGTDADPYRPDVAAGVPWVCVHDFPARGKVLVKVKLPDGTARAAGTVADVQHGDDGEGGRAQLEIEATALTSTQRNAIKTLLGNAGFDVSAIDATVNDRRKLLLLVAGRLAGRADADVPLLLRGYDVG